MFKVGDRVKVVKAIDSIVKDVTGKHGVITRYVREDGGKYGDLWTVDVGNDTYYLFSCELEHDKEHQVLEILRTWKNTR